MLFTVIMKDVVYRDSLLLVFSWNFDEELMCKQALNTLNKANLTELKSFGSPPPAVINVTSAVMVLFAQNGKIPKDRSWAKAKALMSKVDPFLVSLSTQRILG